MTSIKPRRILMAALLSIIVAAGCSDDAREEVFIGEGAGWTAVLFLSNTCKFDQGRFDDPNCRFRNVDP